MSRVQQVSFNFTAANQYSPWIYHDYFEPPFNVGLAVYFGSGLSATLAVQFIMDDMTPGASRQVLISQTTTTITIVDPGGPGATPNGPGVAVGDQIYLTGTPGGSVDGLYNIASVTNNTTYTVTSATSQTLAAQPAFAITGRIFTHFTLTGLTTRTNGNYAFPVWGSRLTSTAFTSGGYGYLVALQGGASS